MPETKKKLTAAVTIRSQRDPAFFFREVLGWEPWARQLEVAEAMREALHGRGPKRIAVRSGNGVGKTALAARVMLWAVRCFPGAVAVTTAPTERQVVDLLWREARRAYESSLYELNGKLYDGQPRWHLAPGRYAVGISPEHSQPERLQGFHGAVTVFIVDEASGVPEAHWEAMKGGLLAGRSALLAIGNPTRTQGEFYDAFHKHAALWKTFHISAFDTPNIAQGPNNKGELPIEGLVTPEAIERAKEEWGEQNPLYQVRVLGQFPPGGSDQLIRLEWVEAAARIPLLVGEGTPTESGRERLPAALGVDVARSGGDETAIALLVGNRLERLETWRGQDTMQTAGVVKRYAEEFPGLAIAVDDGGVGGGVVDRLREQDVPVTPVKFGASPEGRSAGHFVNRLAQLYWNLREWLEQGRLSLPDDARLTAQLTQVQWTHMSDRAIRVYKRGKRNDLPSPDRADALALAVEAMRLRQQGPGVWLP